MDSSINLITLNGKTRLIFDSFTFGYSNPIGNTGCRWTCVTKSCTAFVNTTKAKDKIIGGDFVHTHAKELSKLNRKPTPINTPENSPLTSRDTYWSTATLKPGSMTGADTTVIQNGASTPSHADIAAQKEQLVAELAESKAMITRLQTSLSTMEAAWEVDKTELESLRKQINSSRLSSDSSTSRNTDSVSCTRVKLSIVGDSHVHNLESILSNVLPNYDIKCYPRSGSGVDDICDRPLREHGAQDIVVLFTGTKDVCKKSWSSIETSLSKIIDKFATCRLIVMLIPPRRNAGEFNHHIYSLNVKISNLLKTKGVAILNPGLVLKSSHYSKDNLHLSKLGKGSIAQMIKSSILDGKLFSTLSKPKEQNSKVRSEGVPSPKNQSKNSKNQQNTYSRVASLKTRNFNNRYPNDVQNKSQVRGGIKSCKGKGPHLNQHENRNSRFPTRVVYNNSTQARHVRPFNYPPSGYYPNHCPPPPSDYYHYDYLSPSYNYKFDYYDHYYYRPEPYGYYPQETPE